MSDKTGIEWTDATWNPIRGCSRVSEGCRNCYAESVAARFSHDAKQGYINENSDRVGGRAEGPYHGLIAKTGQWNGNIKVVDHLMDWPLRKQKPQRIFVNSMSDLFHENVPEHAIDRIFSVMALAERHTFQVLTKRPERMREYLSKDRREEWARLAVHYWGGINPDGLYDSVRDGDTVLPNVWLGVSVEDQATADERIPLLLQTPAAVRWTSAEPLLGEIDLNLAWRNDLWREDSTGRPLPLRRIDWVVVGGESGKNARPMQLEWARSLRDQCEAAGVAFLFKQWGEWAPNWSCDEKGKYIGGPVWMDRMGKKAAGRMLDGVLHDGYPT